jgi:glycosyltransferase involved in cell wall biosynthesis
MPRISGILRFAYELIEALAKDFTVSVFTYRYATEAAAREVHRGYEIVRLGKPFAYLAGTSARAFRPDAVIFGSGFWQPWLLLPYWEIFRAGLGRFRGPVILTQYTTMSAKFSQLLRGLTPPPARVIGTTATITEELGKIFGDKTLCIPPGLNRIPIIGATPAPKKKEVRVGYFGHFQPHKGPDILLRVFQDLNPPNAELLIQGEGEMENSLRAEASGWENITIQGYLLEIDSWIRSCDAIVLPYRSAVSVLGYSRVALEALAAGVPLLTMVNPAVAPLVRQGLNGFVCRDEKDLKARLGEVCRDQRLRESLSRGAKASADEFDIGAVAAKYRDLIQSLIRPVGNR